MCHPKLSTNNIIPLLSQMKAISLSFVFVWFGFFQARVASLCFKNLVFYKYEYRIRKSNLENKHKSKMQNFIYSGNQKLLLAIAFLTLEMGTLPPSQSVGWFRITDQQCCGSGN